MVGFRRVIARLWLMGLLCAGLAPAQDSIHRLPPPTTLKIVQLGNGKTRSGAKTLFKVYEALDGNKGRVSYIKFDSQDAARQQIEEWVKLPLKITSREHDQYRYGQVVSDRILAVGELPDSHEKVFIIIRRDGLNCYLIESVSSQVGTQIEDLIQ